MEQSVANANPSIPVSNPPAPQMPQPMMMGGGYNPMMTPPPPPPAAPTMAEGGETSGGGKRNPFKEFFADINMVEAGILALGVATFLYAIHYYKFEMKMTKTGYADLNGRMQRIESEHAKMKAAASESNANGMAKRSRRRMLL